MTPVKVPAIRLMQHDCAVGSGRSRTEGLKILFGLLLTGSLDPPTIRRSRRCLA
jgi:hypothetical protein